MEGVSLASSQEIDQMPANSSFFWAHSCFPTERLCGLSGFCLLGAADLKVKCCPFTLEAAVLPTPNFVHVSGGPAAYGLLDLQALLSLCA